MLSQIACPQVEATGLWTYFTWALTGIIAHSFTQPLLVIAILIGLFGLLHFLPQRSFRRLLRSGLVGVLVLYLLAIFPPSIRLAEGLLTRPLPSYTGQSADAVVMLGRGPAMTPDRVALAAKLWEDHKARLIFASGTGDAPAMIGLLKQKGVPTQIIGGENCSRTTYENAQYTAQVLEPQGVRHILLVTDAPHLLRSTLLFRKFGFKVTPISSSDLQDIRSNERTALVLREYVGLVSYGLMGRLSFEDPNGKTASMSQEPHPAHS